VWGLCEFFICHDQLDMAPKCMLGSYSYGGVYDEWLDSFAQNRTHYVGPYPLETPTRTSNTCKTTKRTTFFVSENCWTSVNYVYKLRDDTPLNLSWRPSREYPLMIRKPQTPSAFAANFGLLPAFRERGFSNECGSQFIVLGHRRSRKLDCGPHESYGGANNVDPIMNGH
jgi:hypothetical protein